MSGQAQATPSIFGADYMAPLNRASVTGSLEDAARAVIYAHNRPYRDGETVLLAMAVSLLEKALEGREL